jgi:hypothetical protein
MFNEMSPFQIKIRRKKKKEKNTPVIASGEWVSDFFLFRE